MYETLQGVVLGTIKYSDKHNIVHVYTDVHGRMAFAVSQGNGRGARMRNAMLMPLSVVELESRLMPGRDLATMRDLRTLHPLCSVHASPVKSAVAMFMGEVLSHCIQERERNDGLYAFIKHSVLALEALERGVANFHICFLYRLGTHLGIQPDVATYRPGACFDMAGGVFTLHPAGLRHIMPPDEAAVIRLIARMNYANLHLFRFSREQRNRVLDTILAYFRLHNGTLGTLRSPEVLKQLFV